MTASGLLTCAQAQRTAFGAAAPAVSGASRTTTSPMQGTQGGQFNGNMRGCCSSQLPAGRYFDGSATNGSGFNGESFGGGLSGSYRNRRVGVEFHGDFRSHYRNSNLVYVPLYYPVYPLAGYSTENVSSSNVSANDYSEPVTPSAHQPDPSWTEGEAIMRDRRAEANRAPSIDRTASQSANRAAVPDAAKPIENEPRTTLVFKDHRPRVTVGSYAIVAGTLLDLSPTHRRKIALADLDLQETARVNEQDGVDFRVPAAPAQK